MTGTSPVFAQTLRGIARPPSLRNGRRDRGRGLRRGVLAKRATAANLGGDRFQSLLIGSGRDGRWSSSRRRHDRALHGSRYLRRNQRQVELLPLIIKGDHIGARIKGVYHEIRTFLFFADPRSDLLGAIIQTKERAIFRRNDTTKLDRSTFRGRQRGIRASRRCQKRRIFYQLIKRRHAP